MKNVLLVILLALLFSRNSLAQSCVKMNDVRKIVLFESGISGMDIMFERFEVVKENGRWNCYKTLTYMSKMIRPNDSIPGRIFIKEIATRGIKRLLTLVTDTNETFDSKQFRVKKERLLAYMDTAGQKFRKPLLTWQKKYLDSVISKTSLNKAVTYVAHAPYHYEHSGVYIGIITKTNDTIVAHTSRSPAYHVPWYIGKRKSFDPGISVLFESFIGNAGFQRSEEDALFAKLNRYYMIGLYGKENYLGGKH